MSGPAGVDKGEGGKYLILPPGYQGAVPDGYIALPSANYQGYALLRSILKSGSEADVAGGGRLWQADQAVSAQPGGQSARDRVPRRHRTSVYDATIPYDLRFFQSLDRFVQQEPWLTRDKAMIDLLKSIGIEKGKPFNPDAATQGILNAAAREAQAWLDLKYETMFPPYYEGRRWVFPIAARGDRRPSEPVRGSGQLPGRRPRRHLHDGVLQHQASRGSASST